MTVEYISYIYLSYTYHARAIIMYSKNSRSSVSIVHSLTPVTGCMCFITLSIIIHCGGDNTPRGVGWECGLPSSNKA